MRGETYAPLKRGRDLVISIHSPHAGRDRGSGKRAAGAEDFNPLSPCGERPDEVQELAKAKAISIHSPHAGRDNTMATPMQTRTEFQSTLPMRGETEAYSFLDSRN